jgi:hypothetical protein
VSITLISRESVYGRDQHNKIRVYYFVNILPKKAYIIWRSTWYFIGSVTMITLQNVQQHWRLTGWWAVRQERRSTFTLLTGHRIQISLRFNIEALWNTNTKNLVLRPTIRKETESISSNSSYKNTSLYVLSI